ncbi:unnamed protein product [Enterobius vermicularis]|uniref:RBR-type E3 ubiquitin transferase n=1 Tax=Enterobius vermicularis TaxID=51028 RepID=A0A0N4V908_ENTVE|nr:unnamed protein product [Enterobius vermicularis]
MHFHIAVAFVIGWKMEKNGVHCRSPNRDSSFISGCQEESGRMDSETVSWDQSVGLEVDLSSFTLVENESSGFSPRQSCTTGKCVDSSSAGQRTYEKTLVDGDNQNPCVLRNFDPDTCYSYRRLPPNIRKESCNASIKGRQFSIQEQIEERAGSNEALSKFQVGSVICNLILRLACNFYSSVTGALEFASWMLAFEKVGPQFRSIAFNDGRFSRTSPVEGAMNDSTLEGTEVDSEHRYKRDISYGEGVISKPILRNYLEKTAIPVCFVTEAILYTDLVLEDGEVVVLNVGPTAKRMVVQKFERIKDKVGLPCMIASGCETDQYERLSLLRIVNKETESVSANTRECSLELCVPDTNYKIHIGLGGMPLEVLFPNEFSSIFVGEAGPSESDKRIDELFNRSFFLLGGSDVVKYSLKPQNLSGFSNLFSFGSKVAAKAAVTVLVKDGKEEGNFYKETIFIWQAVDYGKAHLFCRLSRLICEMLSYHKFCVGLAIAEKPNRNIAVAKRPTFECSTRFELHLKWWRRPSKGTAVFKLSAQSEIARAATVSLLQSCGFSSHEVVGFTRFFDSQVTVRKIFLGLERQGDFSELHVADHIDKDTTSAIIRKRVTDVLIRNGIEIRDVFVVRGKAYPPESAKCRERFASRITNYIKNAMERQSVRYSASEFSSSSSENGGGKESGLNSKEVAAPPFTVRVLPVQDGRDFQMRAEIVFDSYENFIKIRTVKSESFIQFARFVPEQLFHAVEQDLSKLAERFGLVFHKHVSLGRVSVGSKKVVYVNGNDFEQTHWARLEVDRLIDGVFIDCSSRGNRNRALLSNVGQEFLHFLQFKANGNLVITTHFFKRSVQLQGNALSIKSAQQMIQDFLEKTGTWHWPFVITVDEPYYMSGTMTAFMDLVATNAVGVLYRSKVRIEPDFGQHKIYVDASAEDYQRVLQSYYGIEREGLVMITLTLVLFCLLQHNVMVRFSQNALREISDEIRKETGPKRVDRLPPQCIICFDFVDSAWICLENCGHYACKACLLHQIYSLLSLLAFPMRCALCCRALALKDITEALLDGDKVDLWSGIGQLDNLWTISKPLEVLSNCALSFLLNRILSTYRHCRIRNCRGVIELTGEEQLAFCDVCGAAYCRRCGCEEHPNVTCEIYEQMKIIASSSHGRWMRWRHKGNRGGLQLLPNKGCEREKGSSHLQCEYYRMNSCRVWFTTQPYGICEVNGVRYFASVVGGFHGAATQNSTATLAQWLGATVRSQSQILACLSSVPCSLVTGFRGERIPTNEYFGTGFVEFIFLRDKQCSALTLADIPISDDHCSVWLVFNVEVTDDLRLQCRLFGKYASSYRIVEGVSLVVCNTH